MNCLKEKLMIGTWYSCIEQERERNWDVLHDWEMYPKEEE